MEKLIYKHQKFIKSLGALERSISIFSRTDIDKDIRENLVASIIKHFEICYAEIVDSPKKVFRHCFALGLINEIVTKELLDISEARNATTHDYDEENAQEICQQISNYYATFKKVANISIEF